MNRENKNIPMHQNGPDITEAEKTMSWYFPLSGSVAYLETLEHFYKDQNQAHEGPSLDSWQKSVTDKNHVFKWN
jgi:hypothetical protein